MFSYFCGAPICASLATPPSPGMSLRQTRYSSHGGLILLDIHCSLESSRAALVDVATPAALEWRRRGRLRHQLAVTVAQASLRPCRPPTTALRSVGTLVPYEPAASARCN